jgi:hypothetical protein
MIDDTFIEPRTSRDTIEEAGGHMAITVLMLGILLIVAGISFTAGALIF